jgi:hypothetical protein
LPGETLPDDVRPTTQITVTTAPLDKVLNGDEANNQVNLFLYKTESNAAWRNMDLPNQVKPGESGRPPLALNLYYLITAYGQGNNELVSHFLLGQAMRILHDHTMLGREEIQDALAASALQDQAERIRITPQPLSVEEMSKLWSTFQTQYRLSAAYQVTVVLIESNLPVRTPLPVLRRGQEDRGVEAQAGLIPPFPTLLEVLLPDGQPAVRLGETLILTGHHLEGDSLTVRFTHPRFTTGGPVTVLSATEAEVQVRLLDADDDPDAPALWAAGVYTLAVVVRKPGETFDRTSNELPVAVAPRITSALPLAVARDGAGHATITLDCTPQVRPGQRAALLLGSREIPAEPFTDPTGSLTFEVVDAPPGDHWIRLRVDGVDSLLVDRSTIPPQFFADQKATIT